MTRNIYLGIDPGWKNLGFSMIEHDTEAGLVIKLHTQVFNISGYKSITEAIIDIHSVYTRYLPVGATFKQLTMERFIAYKGVDSAEFEIINRLIGGLCVYFEFMHQSKVRLERAIDWKTDLVKALHVQKQFENPSDKLDKKFSIAAAKAAINTNYGTVKTDHECDAICLATLPIYVPKETKKK